MMKLIAFRLQGRFGHFLRADAGASAISYPVPPRTVVIGIIGAVLGLAKDQPQEFLEPVHVAVAGSVPVTHWHKAKLRKDPPEAIPWRVKITQKLDKDTKPEKATLITQEWLFNPSYEIWAALPEPYQSELEARLKERRWHFQPSLGLSEMMADLEYTGTIGTEKLPPGTYPVETVIRQENIQLDIKTVYQGKLAINLLRMPRTVTPERVFSHARYLLERDGCPVAVRTNDAYLAGKKVLMFL
ncbi:CRISPR-associated protein Cas5 [candidate division WS5 bacterium]|uniref:CRISPR-associated protein Cas5 n=1 Tax=candidate division WS5 bacterium TaxID=2093353 RepID=A0A419DBX2_9BACT|nr:MAG: CRISPR-associated protein Cas5 [candidate division WS5 bacterium]